MDSINESEFKSQEVTNPVASEVKNAPLKKGVKNILSFLKSNKEKGVSNPDSVLQAIASENLSEAQPEVFRQLEEANKNLSSFQKAQEIIFKIKDNELVGATLIASLGLLSNIVLGSDASIALEVISAGAIAGGTPKEMVKGAAMAGVGMLASQGAENLIHNGGLDKVVDMAADFGDIGKVVVKEAMGERGKAAFTRFTSVGRMMARSSNIG